MKKLMRTKAGLLILLGMLVLSAASAGAQESGGSLITDIKITGNKNINDQIILGEISSRINEFADETTVNNDIKAIFSLGYFEDVKVSFSPYQEGSRMTIAVKENPVIQKIVIEGNTAYSRTQLTDLLKTRENQILNYKLLREDIERIQNKYLDDGYILGKVLDVKTDPKDQSLNFLISEGVVQGITVEGNANTKDYVILRELSTRDGKIFNEKKLKADMRRIFNLGYFSEINPEFEPGSEKNSIIIILKVKEARTSTVNFGGGFGEREGWFGFADLALNNVMGTAQNLLFKGQSGQEVSTYQFKYYNPWFLPSKLGPRTSFTYRLWNTMGRDIYLTLQDELHIGWDVALGKELRDDYSGTFSFGSESVSPRRGASFEAYISTFIGQSFSYDTRDVWMNPTSGAFHTISLKHGWKATGSATTNYTKYGLDLNRFNPLRDQLVHAWHFGVGLAAGDVPIGEIYWAGGPNTIRGFSLDEIKKGNRKLIMNHELRYTFNETFQAVVFFDWGDAWNSGLPEFSQFIAGWGPGIRINTPLGPIRLDYGTNTAKEFGQGILHFSIGQAF